MYIIDLASVFQVVHIALKLCQVRVCQIEGNAESGARRRDIPFIGEITRWTELVQALGFQFAIELLNESFDRRALEFEPEFANRLGEDLLEFPFGFARKLRTGLFRVLHHGTRFGTAWRILYAHSIVGTV